MNFSHYIVLYGVRVLVQFDINVDMLANDMGAKAGVNASGRSVRAHGAIKAKISNKDHDAINAARYARQQRLRAERDGVQS